MRRTSLILCGAAICLFLPATSGPFCMARSSPQEADLQYIVQQLESNQLTLVDTSRFHAFQDYASSILSQARFPLRNWQYLLLANDLMIWFHDPHTGILNTLLDGPAFPGGSTLAMETTDHLPIDFFWAQDGVVAIPVEGSPSGIRRGDKVLGIGDLTIHQISLELPKYVAGNEPWEHWVAAQLLREGTFLRWLGLIGAHRQVTLRLQRPDGHLYTVSATLEAGPAIDGVLDPHLVSFLNEYVAPPGLQFNLIGDGFAWEIAKSNHYGVFWLFECVNTAAYRAGLHSFFHAVAMRGVPNVVIDLQENTGGEDAIYGWLNSLLEYVATP